ncbi:hypothetical protein COOONC_05977, partial [Cooperia oncophora]
LCCFVLPIFWGRYSYDALVIPHYFRSHRVLSNLQWTYQQPPQQSPWTSSLLRRTRKSRDKILNDVATTFWMVFIFYVFASVAWITYCVISYRRDMEMLKLTAQENGIARYLEIRQVTIFFSDAVACVFFPCR